MWYYNPMTDTRDNLDPEPVDSEVTTTPRSGVFVSTPKDPHCMREIIVEKATYLGEGRAPIYTIREPFYYAPRDTKTDHQAWVKILSLLEMDSGRFMRGARTHNGRLIVSLFHDDGTLDREWTITSKEVTSVYYLGMK